MTVLLYKEQVRGISIFFQQGTAYKHNRFTNHELVQSDLNGKKYERKGTCYFISQHNNNICGEWNSAIKITSVKWVVHHLVKIVILLEFPDDKKKLFTDRL